MKKFFKPAAGIFIAVALIAISFNFANAEKTLPTGTGVYQFAEKTGVTDEPVNVYYHRPKNWKDGDKILVVFHGVNRNAQYHLNALKKSADEKNFLLICPEFTKTKYPGNRYYNYGNVMGGKNYKTLNPSEKWTFNAVNRIIGDVKKRVDATNSKIILFGHSAGGQFMQRYLFFADEIDADLIIAANAGVYIMPNESENFPYGFKNFQIQENKLKNAYEKNVIILLGEKDVLRGNKYFPKSPAADRQGLTRFERGKNFFAQSKAKADELGVKFNWRMITVPNVGHIPTKMEKAALEYI